MPAMALNAPTPDPLRPLVFGGVGAEGLKKEIASSSRQRVEIPVLVEFLGVIAGSDHGTGAAGFCARSRFGKVPHRDNMAAPQ